MRTTLESLLAQLDPSRSLEKTAARADQAINTFRSYPSRVQQWRQFQDLVVEFVRHVEQHVLRLREPWAVSFDFHWARGCQMLDREFGTSNGAQAAFEMARTGNEGGVYRVLKGLAKSLADYYASHEIEARISHWWNQQSTDQLWAAMDQYLAKYGRLLPSELTEGSAARLRANFLRVLAEHPRFMQRLGKVGR